MIKNPNPLNVNEPKLGIQITQRKMLAEVVNNKTVENAKITDICFNNQKYKTQLASIDISGVLKIWDVAQNRLIQQFHASNMWLTTVDVEKQEGKKVACGTLDGKVLVYEINQSNKKGKSFSKDKPNIELFGHSGSIQCVQFLSPQYIIAGSTDSLVSLWDLENPQRYLAIHQQHTGDVLSLHAYENDSNIFISGSSDLTCKIWDIRVKKPVQAEYKGHESAVNTVKFIQMPQPTTFVTGSDDASINLWDLRMKDPIVSFQDSCYYDSIYSIAISLSGRYIFAASENSTLKVFDVLGDTDIYTNLDVGLQQNDGLIKSIDISADGYALGMALGTKSNHKDLLVIM
ncbi:unnamed protein product [Paramecium primaurelia]|uniref:Uncharacterized protein n=4 Tax=Paramecium TaxID=5884 RepID=A0D4A1_PARTE|nr:uncharacterized protein GSPATT00013334001 [Paramecium tetraurelia]CAD8058271.1 unnamed protein product [Paramecium primaurelia]CAD8153416.1 unnamed protein product [Paramecium pentaurelia]CAD8158335.1 unnamed protein product [Paramecium octaurelia]CAK77868.1 unnamed protein product [Paramecium tetraurelia]|eukprot:XP_001445265.1 hypothetical protein (macronuclear) [Paramecium tetraurelia strain d4-2]